MRTVLVLVALVGCKAHEIYGIEPGGGGGGGGGGGIVDAPTDVALDGGTVLHGLVCVVTDLRALAPCATTGAGGLTVQLGTKTATTTDTGAFDIVAPVATNVAWQVSGGSIVTSIMSFGPALKIPAVTATTYADLELQNGILEVAGQGAIVGHVVKAGIPVGDATAVTNPAGVYGPFYDTATATMWSQSHTATFGAAWVPAIAVGASSITITPQAGTPQLVSAIPIGDRAITFVTIEMP